MAKDLLLANPVPLIRNVLDITRLDRVIPIFESEAEAVAAAGSTLRRSRAETANDRHDGPLAIGHGLQVTDDLSPSR